MSLDNIINVVLSKLLTQATVCTTLGRDLSACRSGECAVKQPTAASVVTDNDCEDSAPLLQPSLHASRMLLLQLLLLLRAGAVQQACTFD